MGLYCAISGCTGSRASKHRFPNPSKYPELFHKWLRICGRPELSNRPAENIYNYSRVCHKHFEEFCFGRNNVLLKTAFPTLHIPGPSVDMIGETKQLSEHNILTESSDAAIASISTPYDDEDPMPSTSRGYNYSESPRKGVREQLLSSIGKKKIADLSPKSKFLYTKIRHYKRQNVISRKIRHQLRNKLKIAKSKTKPELLAEATSSMDKVRKRFFQSQLTNFNRGLHGRRYTLDDKVLALALQKQSGSGYKLLSTIFDLPSTRSLQRLLTNVDIKPGLNYACFELFKVMKFTNNLERYCILIFDEMSISSHLQFNAKEDVVEGFEDFGYKRTAKIANTIQVFMLRGISSKWRQPVYYNTSEGPTKAADIVRTIKLIVAQAQKSGLKVVATVCDQGTNNVAAIKSLIRDTQASNSRMGIDSVDNTFKIGDADIIPLYDVPHLFKGIRNNLLKYDLMYEMNSKKKTAKWDHIHTAYKMDPYVGNIRAMPRLTEQHVNPAHIKKMKVSCCTQVFSHSVAKAINLMAYSGTEVIIDKEVLTLPKTAMDTAECCQFFDVLFDSLNGNTYHSTKTWRRAVTTNSGHIDLWNKSLKTLETMTYIGNNERRLVPPSLKNLKFTIINMKVLVNRLFAIGFHHVMMRTFNQDPIENFFGRIRQRGHRFINPTCSSFSALYRSLLVTNFIGKHSMQSNCENDDSSLFFTLKKFVNKGKHTGTIQETVIPFAIPLFRSLQAHPFHKQILVYISGYILQKTPTCRTCTECRKNVLSDNIREEHMFTEAKEFDSKRRLYYISHDLLQNLRKCYSITMHLLEKYISANNLKKRIVATIETKVHFGHICSTHGMVVKKKIVNLLTQILIYNYIKQINNILMGKDLRPISNVDPIPFTNARKIYLKHKTKRQKFLNISR